MAKRKPADDGPRTNDSAIEEMTYEQSIEALESIIERIESGEIGLEDSIRQYERGTLLLKRCREILGQAEQRIETLDAESLAGRDEAGSGEGGA